MHDRGVRRDRRVEQAHELRVAEVRRPVHAQRVSGEPEPLEGPRRRVRLRAQDADVRRQHLRRRGHPAQQRDLRVVLLVLVVGAVRERPAAVQRDDLLLGAREPDAAAGALDGEPQLADLASAAARPPRARRRRCAARRCAPRAGRRPPRPLPRPRRGRSSTAPRAATRRAAASAAPSEQRRRIQRDLPVGQVERRAAGVRLAVECAAGREEGPGVGDRVGHPEPVARAARGAWPGRGHARPAGRSSRTRARPARPARPAAARPRRVPRRRTRRAGRARDGSPRALP